MRSTIDDNSLATETSDEVPNPADGVLTTGEGTSSATIVGNDSKSIMSFYHLLAMH